MTEIMDFTEEELANIISIINSSNVRLKRSRDWPEKDKHEKLLNRFVIAQGKLRRSKQHKLT